MGKKGGAKPKVVEVTAEVSVCIFAIARNAQPIIGAAAQRIVVMS